MVRHQQWVCAGYPVAYEWIFSGTQYVLPHVPPLRVLESDKEQAGRLFPRPFLQSDQVSEGP